MTGTFYKNKQPMQHNNYFLGLLVALLTLSWTSCDRSKSDVNPSDLVDTRDGQRYSIKQYGNQWWMAESLAYNAAGSKLNPNNPFSEYGRLYNYAQALTACPADWHLPTELEWQAFERHLGLQAQELGFSGHRGGTIGGFLKSSSGWQLNNGSNTLLFNAYPAGHYNEQQQQFENLGKRAEFWSATENADAKIWVRNLTKDFDSIFKGDMSKEDYLSCRCVKDE